MNENQSVSMEMPNHILPENSVHQMPQSTVFTQNQQRLPPREKTNKIKHKKTMCLLVVALFSFAYYIMVKNLKPPEVVKEEQKFQEADIQFDTNLGQKVAWIKQKLDHFDQKEKRVWKQRLLIDIDLNSINKKTPIFLNIPPLTAVSQPQSYVNIKQIRSNLEGAAICLQPRYFGQSKPFGDQSFLVKNLKYLTIGQILEDIAYVIDRITSNRFFRIGKENPWIISGDTYTGMIVVWMRAKYPQLTVGAYVSSPILPTAVVPEVGQRLYANMLSGGKKCKAIFLRIINQFEQKAYGPKSDGLLLDIGKGVQLTAEQAMMMIMDKMRQLKRNNFINLCTRSQQQTFKMVNQLLYYNDLQGIDPAAYSLTQLNSPQSWQQFAAVRNRRSFQWLRCHQLGWFQIASGPDKKGLNFKQLTQNFYRNRCKQLFGSDIWPNTKSLINQYANQTNAIKNLIVVHGTNDIWSSYLFTPRNTTSVLTFMIKCSYCDQNFDINSQLMLLPQMTEMRQKQKNSISNWISQKSRK